MPPPPPVGIPQSQPAPMIMGPPLPGQFLPQFQHQGPNQAKPGFPPGAGGVPGAAAKQAAAPPLGAPRLLEIATTKEVTEVYEIHNLRKGKAAGSEKASWKTPQHSTVRAHADDVISKFKLYEKAQNWLNDYENLRHDLLRTMVDTVIFERNRSEESKVHEWIVVAVKGTTGPMRTTNPFGKPRIETKQVQIVLRRQPKPNQIPAKVPGQGAPGQPGAAQQKGGPGQQLPPGQHPGQGQFNQPPQGYPPQHPQHPQHPQQPLPPPPLPNQQMVQQALGMPPPPPRGNNGGNGMRNNGGPPGGFAPNYNPRVAKYVEELDMPSDREDVETIEHLEYKRRGNKDSRPALRLSGALPPVSPRLRRSLTADERRDRDLRDLRDRDDRRRDDRDHGHHRSSHRHARYSKHHTHDGGYHSEEELDFDYDRRSDVRSDVSADASSLDSLDDLRRRTGGGRLRHSHAGDLHRSGRDSVDLLSPLRRSSHRHHRRHGSGGGHRSTLRRARSAERILEHRDTIADLTYQLNTARRGEASAAAAATAAANAAAAAAAAAAGSSRPHQHSPRPAPVAVAAEYYPPPRLIEAGPLPTYYADADRRFDDYPPVAAHPPLAYRGVERPRGLPPLAPLAPPAGEYYPPPRRRSIYGDGELRYDRTYDRAHAAAAAAGPPPRGAAAPPYAPESPVAGAAYDYPLNRARHTSRAAAHASPSSGPAAPAMSRRASAHGGYAGSENLSDYSRSSSYDSRSDEGGARPPAGWDDLEQRTRRLRERIAETLDDAEWDGGPRLRGGVRYGRYRD
jgi:hypothetical protein